MNAITTRAELESSLRAFAARLVARQVARTAFSALASAAVALGLGVVFLQLLPRLLLGAHLSALPLLAAGGAGFLAGVAWELRRYRAPSLQDAAMALEARLSDDSGALAAALRMSEQDAFYAPVLARASDDLREARLSPAPLLIPTRRLVLVPMLALVVAVALIAVVTARPPQNGETVRIRPTPEGNGTEWPGVDVGGGRSKADREAYRAAQGMKETAAQLSRAALVLRDQDADQAARNTALDAAKRAVGESGDETAGLSAEEIPAAAPTDRQEREALAARLETAAGVLSAKAAKLEKGERAAALDRGSSGEFKPGNPRTELVPMPAMAPARDMPAEAIAAQTPARRALAERAVKALEQLQNK